MQDEEDKKDIKSPSDEAQGDSAESEDEIVEFEFNDDGEEDLKKTLKKIRLDLKVAKKEKEEYLTGWQKERADFANYKKSEEDRNASYKENLREHILGNFLSIMDSFNMAFANKEAWEKVDEGWRKGVEYIYSQMNSIFEEYGVREIGKEGDIFDPTQHESIDTIETDDQGKDHTISKVIQKGYKMGDRVMRPARVNVYGYKGGK